jgi:predicted glycoside hydrolase/deacetylase ChbG (UPF0249 family)
MQPNPILKKLGFAPDDRLVVIHADDIGMCHASIAAYRDLMDVGLVSSAAVMVTCPWFPLVADYCRQHPDVDMGVHLTLTSEWDAYRWGPISTRDSATGLLDDEGYFYRTSRLLQQHANPAAVRIEWEAQIQAALARGIDVTHVDTHMLSAFYAPYLETYFNVSRQYRLPAMFLRRTAEQWMEFRRDPETATYASEQVQPLEAEGLPLVDYFYAMSLVLGEISDRVEEAKHAFSTLPPGITHFIIHPSTDTPELRAIAPDWRCRVSDYEIFTSDVVQTLIKSEGINVINYRLLRDLMR